MIKPENTRNVTQEQLNSLIKKKTPEDFEIEYKRELTHDKKELKADVIQFANTNGGVLIIGIEERDRLPISLVPIKDDVDAIKSSINQTLRSNIEPAIQGLIVQEVEVDDGFVILIGIPESKNKPHCYVRDGARRFYGRNSSGKFEMDLPHIRDTFLNTRLTTIAMEGHRSLRLSQIASNEMPIELQEKEGNRGKLVIQIIPHLAFESSGMDTYDLNKLQTLPTLARSEVAAIHNIDGVLSAPPSRLEYTQLYRDGIIEAVGAGIASPYKHWSGHDDTVRHLRIDANREAVRLIYKLTSLLRCIKSVGVEAPYRIFVSLTDVKGVRIATDQNSRRVEQQLSSLLYKSNFRLPTIDIFDSDIDFHGVMEAIKPILDVLWNADGKPACDLYSRWLESEKWLLKDIAEF